MTFIFDGHSIKPREESPRPLSVDLPHTTGIQEVREPSDLSESLKELNADHIQESRMSGIDLRARLSQVEIAGLLAIDTLVALKVLPMQALAFTRQKKRLSVSLEGKGRGEIVQIVSGERSHQEQKGGMGMTDRIKTFITGQPPRTPP